MENSKKRQRASTPLAQVSQQHDPLPDGPEPKKAKRREVSLGSNNHAAATQWASLHAETKPSLSFSHPAFASRNIAIGRGLKFHEFSSRTLAAASVASYVRDTGLVPMETRQTWGLPPEVQKKMYRSRRGSISGMAAMPNGTVEVWRLHSLPTSEALRAQTVGDALQVFEEHAKKMSQPAMNTKGNEQSVNGVLSDVGKVRFDNKFVFDKATHAMGVSGSGVNRKTSSEPADLFAPSIEVARADGKAATPAQTYHSEPMAISLHNSVRDTQMENDSELVGIVASFPNQVCHQCGRMFQEKIGKNSILTSSSGRPFGGQKEGVLHATNTGTTVSRAAPMNDLSHNNSSEVTSIYNYHNRQQ